MVDATEPLKLLIEPANGADSGTWDQPMNSNTTAVGGMLGGLVTKSLTNANVTLTMPAVGTVTPGTGPTESQNAILRFTGTLTGNCAITVPLPGYYIADNRCTVGAFYVILGNGGGGDQVGLPPGCPVHVYSDGTNVRFVNTPPVGSYMDLAVSSVPNWIGACTTLPWLSCDGTVYNVSAFPFLGSLLGSTFGGNGSTTFGVPDLRNRSRLSLGSGRVTTGISGINGATIGSGGGNETLQAHTHGINITDPGHAHTVDGDNSQIVGAAGGGINAMRSGFTKGTTTSATGISASIVSTGGGGSQNMPPALISGMTFVKT